MEVKTLPDFTKLEAFIKARRVQWGKIGMGKFENLHKNKKKTR